MEVNVIAKRWGSSIGVIIPKEVVEAKRIKENDKIVIRFGKRKPKAGVLFGRFANWKKSGQEIKDEMKRGWESEFDRQRRKRVFF